MDVSKSKSTGDDVSHTQMYPGEDEIDLWQLVEIIINGKLVIIGVVIISFLSALGYLIISRPEYRIYMMLRPILWSEENIISWFDVNKNYAPFISKELSDSKADQIPTIKATYKRFTATKEEKGIIVLEMFYHDKNRGVEILKNFYYNFGKFLTENDPAVTMERLRLENKLQSLKEKLQSIDTLEIARINMEIKRKVEDIELLNNRIKIIREKRELNNKMLNDSKMHLAEALKNFSILAKEQAKLSNRGFDLSVLLLTTVIQQNIAYASELQRYIKSLQIEIIESNMEEESTLNKISGIQKEIYDLKLKVEEELEIKRKDILREISENQNQLMHLSPFEKITDPLTSIKPVRPRKALTIAVSLGVGAFLGVMIVLLRHFWVIRESSLTKD